MTDHTCRTYDPACVRCDLSRAEPPPATPLLCRLFGHRLVTVPLYQINPTRWVQPVTIPTRTFCRRCRWEADRD